MDEQTNNGYEPKLTSHLEMLFGEGLLSGGATDSITRMLEGIDVNGYVVDIGSGLGGVPNYVATHYPVSAVHGFDVLPHLARRSRQLAKAAGLDDRLFFQTLSEIGEIPLSSGSIDLIYSKEVILHVSDKEKLGREIARLLKPGGTFVCVDWLHASPIYSDDMRRFIEIDGLAFHLCSVSEYTGWLERSGLSVRIAHDHNAFAEDETREILSRLEGEMRAETIARFGAEQFEEYLTSWRLQLALLSRRELLIMRFVAVRED